MLRYILPGLAVLTLLGGSSSVRAGDDLKKAKENQEIAVQKLKAQVSEAVERSRKLEKTDAVEARFLVERTLRAVRDSQDLLEKERTPLVNQLNARLTDLSNSGRQAKIEQEQKGGVQGERPRIIKPPVADGSEGLSGVAKRFQDSAKGANSAAQQSVRERERAIGKVQSNIETAMIPTDEPYTLPKYWKQLSESRKKLLGPQLTETEVKLLKTLNSTISPNYSGDKFKAVLGHLQDKTGLTLIMDEASVQDLNLDYDDPVTLKLNKITVRTALKKILGDRGLTYIIKEGALQVMTPKRAAEYTVIRTYPIDGLIAPNQMALQYGPFVARAQMLNNAQQLISMIQSSIEPSYWQPNGPGVITFNEATMSLSIRASAEMHYTMPGLMGR